VARKNTFESKSYVSVYEKELLQIKLKIFLRVSTLILSVRQNRSELYVFRREVFLWN